MRFSYILTAFIICVAVAALVLKRDQVFNLVRGSEAAQLAEAEVEVETARTAQEEAQAAFDEAKKQLEASTVNLEVAESALPKEEMVEEKKLSGVSVLAIKSVAKDVTSGIVLRGQTAAFKSVQVKAETSGAVISQPIRKGTLVEKGELLCELEVGTKAAAVAEAKARLVEARSNKDAATQLVKKGFTSETTVKNREAALEAAIAGLDRAESDLANTKILAPFNGLLESDTGELGDFMQPGTPCATVLALDPIKLVGYATEQQVSLISVAAPAGARLIDGKEVQGKVTFISRSADQTTRTFLVEITVPNSNLAIRDGSTADILIGLAGIKGHLLPQSSLTLNDKGQLGVRLAKGNRSHFQEVTVVRDTKDGIWVTGLDAESDVIVLGQEYVTEGTEIRVSYKDAN